MANYCFQVRYYDRSNPDAIAILETARRDSVVLKYNGSDEKIQDIIGATCTVDVLDRESLDGKFLSFYTNDETQWLTQIWFLDSQTSTETLFWQGHIMPEQYVEPYTTNNLFVQLTATDGLGRLKGKELPDTYYSGEFAVTDVLQECLSLTGNDLDLYFAPAIVSYTLGNWHQIYVSGESFRESQKDDGTFKKKKTYKIFQELLRDLQCVCYQDWGKWFIVGYNLQSLPEYSYFHYNHLKEYVGIVSLTRTPFDVKKIQLATPDVGVVTPHKEITVKSPILETMLSEELVEQSRDGWVLPAPLDTLNVGERLLFRRWLVEGYNNTGDATGWTPVVHPRTGILNLGIPRNDDNSSRYVRLDKKLFVEQGQKLKFDFDFDFPLGQDEGVRVVVDFVIDDLNGNQTIESQQVRFDELLADGLENHNDQLTKELVVTHNGYLDVRIYKPTATGVTTLEMFLKDIRVEDVDYVEQSVFNSVINEDYSIVDDIDLVYSDDVRGGVYSFRLARIEDRSVDFYTKPLDVKSVFEFGQLHYVVLDLRELFFVKDFPNQIQVQQGGGGAFVSVPDVSVTYNFMNGEQMVFSYNHSELGFEISTNDVLQCLVKDYTYPVGDRLDWQLWVDNVYGVLPKRYGETVTEVYRNLFKETHYYLDLDILGIFTFSSLLTFNYKGPRTFYPLNLTLRLDIGKVSGRFNEAFYGRAVLDNIPPVVDAGDDQELVFDATTTNLLATASDPDGVIVGIVWQVLSGVAVITDPTSLSTGITGISSDVVVFRVTVTDDDGLTASDTVTVSRVAKYIVNNTIIENTNDVDAVSQTVVRIEQLVFNPVIPPGEILTIEHNVLLTVQNDAAGATTTVFFDCRKNGQLITQHSSAGSETFSLSYINGDVITYEVSSDSQSGSGQGTTQGLSRVRLQNFNFQTDLGTISNSPYTIQASSQASS